MALAILAPQLLRPVERVWMSIAGAMGWVMTRVVLTLLFYIAITPIGLLTRLAGKRFLDLGMDGEAESYWIRRSRTRRAREEYEKQF